MVRHHPVGVCALRQQALFTRVPEAETSTPVLSASALHRGAAVKRSCRPVEQGCASASQLVQPSMSGEQNDRCTQLYAPSQHRTDLSFTTPCASSWGISTAGPSSNDHCLYNKHSPPECQRQRRASTLSPPPPRTVEQLQACSISRKSLMAAPLHRQAPSSSLFVRQVLST